MLKYLLIILLMGLGAVVVFQQFQLKDMRRELSQAQQNHATVELEYAGSKGTLAGLYLATRTDRLTLLRLRRLVQVKEHLIESLQQGQVLTITAYNAEAAQTDSTPFITASNSRVRPGIVAVSQDLFRKGWVFGRKVYIVGYGVYTIEDLLARRKRNQLDIFMTSKTQALQFGRKRLRVFLLGA